MTEPARAPTAALGDGWSVDDGLHPWVVKARAIDAAGGGSELSAETLARFVRILRVATDDARRAEQGRNRGGRTAPRAAG
jgi:hypothetical protein